MIRFIGAKGVSEKQQLGEKPILLDITSEPSYRKLHPRAAVNIPLQRLRDTRISHSYLPNPAQEIVIFSEDFESETAWEAAELLHAQGYENLYIYHGGKTQWMEDGLAFQAVHYPPPPKQPPETERSDGNDSAA